MEFNANSAWQPSRGCSGRGLWGGRPRSSGSHPAPNVGTSPGSRCTERVPHLLRGQRLVSVSLLCANTCIFYMERSDPGHVRNRTQGGRPREALGPLAAPGGPCPEWMLRRPSHPARSICRLRFHKRSHLHTPACSLREGMPQALVTQIQARVRNYKHDL